MNTRELFFNFRIMPLPDKHVTSSYVGIDSCVIETNSWQWMLRLSDIGALIESNCDEEVLSTMSTLTIEFYEYMWLRSFYIVPILFFLLSLWENVWSHHEFLVAQEHSVDLPAPQGWPYYFNWHPLKSYIFKYFIKAKQNKNISMRKNSLKIVFTEHIKHHLQVVQSPWSMACLCV